MHTLSLDKVTRVVDTQCVLVNKSTVDENSDTFAVTFTVEDDRRQLTAVELYVKRRELPSIKHAFGAIHDEIVDVLAPMDAEPEMSITLWRGSKFWMAEASGQLAHEWRQLFNSTVIPTAYTSDVDSTTVLEGVRAHNPNVRVDLANYRY